ncbi:MAG: uroporphyrinogen decarboxylase family protein [Saccharofermentanales bacterium]
MNSRERLLKAINHEPVDHVPVSAYELVGWNENSWENNEPSYKKLMDVIREYTDCIYMLNPGTRKIPNPVSENKEWDENGSHYMKHIYRAKGKELTSLYRSDPNLKTVWTLKHLLENIEDIDIYLSFPYEQPEFDMDYFYEEQRKLGDKGLMMVSLPDPVCLAAELFEMGTFLVHSMTEQKRIKNFLDAIHERQMHSLRCLLKNDVKDIIFRICGPEYVTPPFLSPEYFHDYVTCYLSDICRSIKEAGGIPRIHSHGKIAQVIDQFAMTDAQAIDPVEPPPDGDITLSELKKRYGDRFCFFGNIELKELECSDRNRIDALVKEAMTAAKQGSGFVLMPTAAPINIPLAKKTEENFMQMIESALKYGM